MTVANHTDRASRPAVQHIGKRQMWELLQEHGLDEPMGEPLPDVVAMLERAFGALPQGSGGPFQEVRVETDNSEYVWRRRS